MFKDNHFILIVFIMSDIYDRKKLYEKTMDLQIEKEGYFRYKRTFYEIRPL